MCGGKGKATVSVVWYGKVYGMPVLVSEPRRLSGSQMCEYEINSEHPHKIIPMNFLLPPLAGFAWPNRQQDRQDRTGVCNYPSATL